MPAGLPPRLLAVLVPVCGAGAATLAWAAFRFGSEPHSGRTLLGLALLVMASMFAERFPVPVEGADAGGVSLLYVFVVATIVLFGWQTGALLAAIGTFTQLLQHRPLIRVSYNAAVFGISAAVAGAAILWLDTHNIWQLLGAVGIASFVDYSVNMLLITLIVSVHSGRSFTTVLVLNARGTIIPFALMGSAALMLVVLWQRSPVLSAALVGPLIAISLYQRSTHRALRAMRLALTDPLTGLGNHRHFHERLQRELVAAEEASMPLSLCLIDVDDFKRVNDNHGHPAGDRVLSQVAARLRQGGEAFRLGGDEFAVLLPDHDEATALETATSIVERLRSMELDRSERITVSAGLATFPVQGVGRDELIRLADSALYWAKEHGKNRVRIYRPEVVELAELKKLASSGADRAARFRAAASLAKAVDARDVYTGSHSERVSDLAARVAERMGLAQEIVELTRLAASLHDLGKLAIPEEILRKPGPLTDPERLVLERHPQIGYRMLESLGVDPVAEWVLHHHERWDGTGYPDGLHEDDIPLGARIIFVADAFDAMTNDRVYQGKLSVGAALDELERCAGTQFDPYAVAALVSEFAPLAAPLAVS
ncbi:MAG TPA: diguanylate cyclase [Verrucomicrobiae bacterium]|nr:diguanylate cyclase [Verrucomicrobiae bacterium]